MSAPEQYVAVRLVRLSLRPDGSLPRTPLLTATVRAALLADLALSGALTSTSSGLELDTTPSGFRPADNLLAGVAAQPDRTLEWWVRRGPNSIGQVVDELLTTGRWTSQRRHRRYVEHGMGPVKADAVRVRRVLAGGTPDAPGTAVLAALLGVIGTDEVSGGRRPGEAELAGCGDARWLVPDLVDYLLARRRLLAASASEAGIGLAANFIQ